MNTLNTHTTELALENARLTQENTELSLQNAALLARIEALEFSLSIAHTMRELQAVQASNAKLTSLSSLFLLMGEHNA